jgi:peptidyl-prolyl cis-trans isomerase SurA
VPVELAVDLSDEALPDAELNDDRAAARHILVAYAGAKRAKRQVTRTKDEARQRADGLRQRALASEPFASLARANSDGPSSGRGGWLGAFTRGTMHPAFEVALWSVEPGKLAPVAMTPFGYHVILREPIVEGHFAQIVVQWRGAARSNQARPKEEAKARIGTALEAIFDHGMAFDVVARRYSDGPLGPRGGDLGWVPRGQLDPVVEKRIFALKPGQTTEIFETEAGFHLIRRLE